MQHAPITLLLGGARSGKSRHGEAIITASPPPWCYIATAQPFDDEMRDRIAQHQARRAAGWQTIEAPVDLPGAIIAAGDQPTLVDCLTLWLTNLMLGGHDIAMETRRLLAALDRRASTCVLVANEVGLGIVPDTRLGRDFRDAAGVLNQTVAARADTVLFLVAGLPMRVK